MPETYHVDSNVIDSWLLSMAWSWTFIELSEWGGQLIIGIFYGGQSTQSNPTSCCYKTYWQFFIDISENRITLLLIVMTEAKHFSLSYYLRLVTYFSVVTSRSFLLCFALAAPLCFPQHHNLCWVFEIMLLFTQLSIWIVGVVLLNAETSAILHGLGCNLVRFIKKRIETI